jgi:hypothetical protein
MLTVVPSRCDMFRTLFGYIQSLENIMPFSSKRVAMCFRRKRAEVTKEAGSFRNSRLHLPPHPPKLAKLIYLLSPSICIPKHYSMSKAKASPGVVFSRLLLGFIYFHYQNFPKLY